MSFITTVLRKDIFNTTTWSGGTTTELLIHPPHSTYNSRNFNWRISSAKVEIEESTFTYLPNIWRKLMVIEGEALLSHENHYDVLLSPFKQDSFSGDWTTKSKGKITDFNLMTAKGYTGTLEAISLCNNGTTIISVKKPVFTKDCKEVVSLIYCPFGNIEFMNESSILNCGDLIYIHGEYDKEDFYINLRNLSSIENKIILVTIYNE